MMLSPEQRAEDAENAGNLSVALTLWWQIASTTRDAFAFCRAGLLAERLGKWSEAQEAFEKAVKFDPMCIESLEYLGLLFLTRPDHDIRQRLPVAKEWFLRALKIQPSARLLTFLGTAQATLNETDAAKRSFEQALKLDAMYEEAYFNLGLIEKERDLNEAQRFFEKAIEIDPDYFKAHQQLGIALQKQGQILDAEYHFRRCLEIDPQDYWSRLYLANALAVQGRKGEAEHEYRVAIRQHPEEQAGLDFYANFLDSLARKREAEEIRHRKLQ